MQLDQIQMLAKMVVEFKTSKTYNISTNTSKIQDAVTRFHMMRSLDPLEAVGQQLSNKV